ncbi:TPA: type IV pilus biogenesis/stability protein PilW [Legionella pneumophila]|uniref:type IV pilus biogenesis/stability protein PilW n=1 Tax=Legionella pneumophila TaxID=446 RepID=UPI0007892DBF|nr:type IV pilus biogenesis/stability protein PilW [Legionella pneumophila]MDW8879046.1 type IV pilus biogenesis/stability protein PilW [Legionella pneumophila subsp. fraseri]MDW8961525.1 type IV pilus biogenesis/stability protein PilW [Legionella pneumophila subsp. fraseri]MDW9036198.1 type IV pilus biogenesis/stability protein PilW [Legionella pneumophila subsp. fraseri]MDW9039045.1 type IV pilus biogenesis/stability protein PilW [Legionella pneumophila subsp. fraseri]MDW9041893.1 type IV pi
MLKSIRYLLIIITCLFLEACQHAQDSEEPNAPRKVDLSKAASFNVQLGLGYLKQGDRPRAKKKLLTALEQQPDSADVNAALAYYFEQTKELDQARKFYHKAMTLSQNGGAQMNNYGAFLCRQGDYKNAEIYFLKAVKDQNYVNTSGAYENAGLCAMAIPDHDKAIIYFTKALNQDPSRKESLYELVKLQSKIGHDKEALDLLQKHADLVLNDKVMLGLAKDIANKTGQYTLAAEYENSFNKMEPTNNISGVNDEYNSSNG